jgi:WhiB family transcriptional regulator, redox-sensing transcriptional regulator
MSKDPWYDYAACGGGDLDRFFSTDPADQQVATRICLQCPVRQACLQYAMDRAEPYGVWGGLNERERRNLRRVLRRRDQAEQDGTSSHKSCRRCRETRPQREFGKDRLAKDGLNNYCKPCVNYLARERHARQKAAS